MNSMLRSPATKKCRFRPEIGTFPYFSAKKVRGENSDPNRDPNRKRETKEAETTGAQRIAGFTFLRGNLVWVKMRSRKWRRTNRLRHFWKSGLGQISFVLILMTRTRTPWENWAPHSVVGQTKKGDTVLPFQPCPCRPLIFVMRRRFFDEKRSNQIAGLFVIAMRLL